jgi:hypothetical protein
MRDPVGVFDVQRDVLRALSGEEMGSALRKALHTLATAYAKRLSKGDSFVEGFKHGHLFVTLRTTSKFYPRNNRRLYVLPRLNPRAR